jgi:hypothetical protein
MRWFTPGGWLAHDVKVPSPNSARRAFLTCSGRPREPSIPIYDVDGKLWSVQYANSDGTKRFARDSGKEACFHVVGAEGSGQMLYSAPRPSLWPKVTP